MNQPTAYDHAARADLWQPFKWAVKRVCIQYGQIGEHPGRDLSAHGLVAREPCAVSGTEPERLNPADSLIGSDDTAASRLTSADVPDRAE